MEISNVLEVKKFPNSLAAISLDTGKQFEMYIICISFSLFTLQNQIGKYFLLEHMLHMIMVRGENRKGRNITRPHRSSFL